MSKDADVALPPASMSKLMTLYMAFEAVERGRLELDQKLLVSADAARYGGSTMFLQEGERVSSSVTRNQLVAFFLWVMRGAAAVRRARELELYVASTQAQ